MKTAQSRIDDAVHYIHEIGKSALAQHLSVLVAGGEPSKIGKDLSLGTRPDDEDDPQYADNTRKRNALRALLLCQRVYFSELWAQFTGTGGVQQPQSFLPNNWKADSLTYWGPRNEDEIVEGILTFAITTGRAELLADAADAKPDATQPTPVLTLTRASQPFPGITSCYGSVMVWLFKSGLVSYGWYMKNQGANNKSTLRSAFGPARVIWDGARPFKATDTLATVPRGHIVHLYVDNPIRWNGHWLVSLGDGYARACNNDTTDGTPNDYSARCSLNNQFINGYKHAATGGAPGAMEPGVAEVVNPLEIPGRM